MLGWLGVLRFVYHGSPFSIHAGRCSPLDSVVGNRCPVERLAASK